MAEVQVSGLAELKKALEGLPAKIEGNVMRGALRAGANVFRDAARNAAPEDTGALRKSIRVASRRQKRRTGWVNIDVKAGNKEAWYANQIEFGTASFYTGHGKSVGKPYIIRAKNADGEEVSLKGKRSALRFGNTFASSVTHPGIKPQPFMRPTFDSSANQMAAIEATATYIRRRLPKEIVKAGK